MALQMPTDLLQVKGTMTPNNTGVLIMEDTTFYKPELYKLSKYGCLKLVLSAQPTKHLTVMSLARNKNRFSQT